jgi:hypothetical protein
MAKETVYRVLQGTVGPQMLEEGDTFRASDYPNMNYEHLIKRGIIAEETRPTADELTAPKAEVKVFNPGQFIAPITEAVEDTAKK